MNFFQQTYIVDAVMDIRIWCIRIGPIRRLPSGVCTCSPSPPSAALPLSSQVDPQFYSFRWITLLLSQEFPLPDTLRIWDMILSDPHGRTDCLLRICTALILHVRERLMQGDFTVIMKTLQRYPPVDINVILQRAAALCPCKEIP